MIQGSLVALVTPMHIDGSIDWLSLKRLVHWHIEKGTHGIVSVGTTGESPTLDFDEHIEVIQKTVEYAAKKIPVIAGTGANSTTEAIELTHVAKQVGADAALLVTPYYNKPTQEGLYLHFKAIAEAVDLPQILYNVPGRTACDLLNETVLRLAQIKNIVGIKDATGQLERGRALIAAAPRNFFVYSGDDATAIDFILSGAKGNISVTANVTPDWMSAACALALQGRADEARAIDSKMRALHQLLFCESNPIPVKWAVHELGLIESLGIRLPLTPLSERAQPALREVLLSLKVPTSEPV
jgi:4-hydroxy-tetrahydrodipicolinate synthase